jgi:hypothetical protein
LKRARRLTALLSGKRFSPRPAFATSTRLPPLNEELEAERRYMYVLPVLFLEYLALRYVATRGVRRGTKKERCVHEPREA